MNHLNAQEIVRQTREDFEKRRDERKSLELQWRLNMNFLAGNQYADISPRGDIEDQGKQYFWQEREVYNHIAPIIETRISKLARVHGKVRVRPLTSDVDDVSKATLSTKILTAIEDECNLSEIIKEGNVWSETCGSVFYKVSWDTSKGKLIARSKRKGDIREGDVSICVVPPFEMYPDNLNAQDLSACNSIIHARVYSVDAVKDTWGVEVKGETVNVFTMDTATVLGGLGYSATIPKAVAGAKDNHVLVLEKYVAPTRDNPFGRLIIVAGDKLLYYGDLPYACGIDGKADYPFVRQTAIKQAGTFFGVSVIERIIPVQRAYNAVKNRKHEYMNRIAMGVLAVEDGSVDCDNLEEEGLSPGKILVYRQGSNPPKMVEQGSVPTDFLYEEKQLLEEFNLISGVSELMQLSHVPSSSISGVALSLLIQQDETRLSVSADSLRNAIKVIGQLILRLYKQFAKNPRLKRISGACGEVERASFCSSDVTSDDLVFETENELLDSPSSRRAMVLELFKLGLLTDEDGKLSPRMKAKTLELLGFGAWEQSQDLTDMHLKVARRENLSADTHELKVSETDDHRVHIGEHTAQILASPSEKLVAHVKEHRKYLAVEKSIKTEANDGE
ncbi:MAG: hypothetical protein IKC83_04250 [Clostridia bacterium]|nr:hypothetical protein [Clostridia bacterium]